jgi:hypothetical protein
LAGYSTSFTGYAEKIFGQEKRRNPIIKRNEPCRVSNTCTLTLQNLHLLRPNRGPSGPRQAGRAAEVSSQRPLHA